MGGAFGQQFKRLFESAMGQKTRQPHHKKATHYAADVVKFVDNFQRDKLFSFVRARQHDGFVGYQSEVTQIKNAEKLGKHLRKLSKGLDFWKRRAANARPQRDADGDEN